MSRRNGSRGCRRVRSGDWACACGQRYRVLAADGVVWIWPKNCADGYRVEPIGAECVCGLAITRGAVLSGLFGASVLGATAPG